MKVHQTGQKLVFGLYSERKSKDYISACCFKLSSECLLKRGCAQQHAANQRFYLTPPGTREKVPGRGS
ncbi:hypothetical protein NN561_015373 [Cricetulus griseus]